MTVELEDPRTGGSIATKTLVADDADQAASVVAGFVGRNIFKNDPTTPPWCVGSFDGEDLAVMLLGVMITIGWLVIQVFGGPGADAQALRAASRPGTQSIGIFPHQAGTVHWPPPDALDGETMDA